MNKKKLNEVLLKKYAQQNLDIQYCPSDKCDYFGFVPNGNLCFDDYECDKCHTKWKPNNDYSSFWSNFKTKFYLQFFTQPCTNCKVDISKNGGCKHMTCTKCRFQFCWICRQNWRKHNYRTCQLI